MFEDFTGLGSLNSHPSFSLYFLSRSTGCRQIDICVLVVFYGLEYKIILFFLKHRTFFFVYIISQNVFKF
jgi:hypothetical protein